MTSARAITKYVRVPPRKARLAADLVRGLDVEDAAVQLAFSKLKAGKLILKTLESAIANAETQLSLPRKNLYISEICVNAGPMIKRAKSKNKGGRVPVMKRTSHFVVVVSAKS